MLAADDDQGPNTEPASDVAAGATQEALPRVAAGSPYPAETPAAAASVPLAPVTEPAAQLVNPIAATTEAAQSQPEVVACDFAAPVLEKAEVSAYPESDAPEDAGAEGSDKPGGLLGKIKEKAGTTVQRVAEMESVQKGVAILQEKGKAIAESERVQQSVDWAKKKTAEIAESERVQKGMEKAKETAKVVTERTQQGLEAVKEKTKAMKEGAGAVWERGRGKIQRIRTEGVSAMAWRGSARDTLAIAEREEQWKDIKVQGAEELSVPARREHTSAYHVSKGSTLRWTFRVKEHDIGFSVRMRVQQWGGSREDEVLEMERYDSADTISGSWVADEDRTIILAFDNTYSKLRSKTVAYLVGTEKAPVYVEAAAREEAAAAPAEPAAPAKPII
eukprot:TRINITY_DN7340_c0_g7_i1.p1 TRINITY_DN7340_c0_g7~~TRINITY_DN7340_c0_g7_i1.p1  ORF type:complete len:390 (-),score=118.48 TRINITY_DN7340_c0_g7_i1:134-1303(-)